LEKIQVKNLWVRYRNGADIVRGVDFSLNEGEIFAVVGESGCGKSTFLRSLAAILPSGGRIEKGSVRIGGNDIIQMNHNGLRSLRGKELAMVFQEPGGTLNPVRKIGSQFIETIRYHFKDMTKEQAKVKAIRTMEKTNLPDPERILAKYPFSLSGGMKQRVAIAMAMVMEPGILLADEPTSALDATVQVQVVDELMKLRDTFGTAIVIVTHNISLASYMADRIGVMYAGEMIETGKSKEVIEHPAHPYTKALVNAVPEIASDELPTGIDGTPPSFLKLPPKCAFSPRCSYKTDGCENTILSAASITGAHFAVCNRAHARELGGVAAAL